MAQEPAFRRRLTLPAIVSCALVLAVSLAGAGQSGVSQPRAFGPAQAIPKAAEPTAAAVSGVVTDAVTHRPLGGVTVSLGMDRAPGMLRPPPLQETITDEKGRFVFWPVEAGSGYFVNASAFGYFEGGYGRDGSERAGRRIALADRQWFDRADISMWRPGAVSGRVLDEHGDPVVGVMVRVMRQVHVAGRAQIASGPNTTTDDRGAYRFAGLLPGRYFVVVPSTQMAAPASALAPLAAKLDPSRVSSGISPPTTGDPMLDVDGATRLVVGRFPTPPASDAGRLMAYPVSWHPGAPTVHSASPIDLDYGTEQTGADVRLEPTPTVRLSGIVRGPAAVPSGLTLRLMPAGSEGLGLGSEAATALVAADGTFTFVNVPAGEYVIDARGTITEYEFNAGSARYNLPLPPGTTSTGGSAMSLPSGTPGTGMTAIKFEAGDRYWGRLPLAVGERDLVNLVLDLQPTMTLKGRLVWEGRTQPAAQRPFIVAEPADGDPALGQSLNMQAPGAEEFLIEGLLPGQYVLRIRGTGDWTVKSIASGGRDYTNTPFDVAGGRDFTDVTITLTDQTPIVEGTVSDSLGRSAAAAVIVFPAQKSEWSNYGLSPLRIKATRVDNRGAYRMTGLPAGAYLIVAVGETQADGWHDPAFFEAAASLASRLTLAWGRNAALNLRIVEVPTR